MLHQLRCLQTLRTLFNQLLLVLHEPWYLLLSLLSLPSQSRRIDWFIEFYRSNLILHMPAERFPFMLLLHFNWDSLLPVRKNFLFLIILYCKWVLYKKLSYLIVAISPFIQELLPSLFNLFLELLSDLIRLVLQLGGVLYLLQWFFKLFSVF